MMIRHNTIDDDFFRLLPGRGALDKCRGVERVVGPDGIVAIISIGVVIVNGVIIIIIISDEK